MFNRCMTLRALTWAMVWWGTRRRLTLMEGSWQGPTWKGIFSGTLFGRCFFLMSQAKHESDSQREPVCRKWSSIGGKPKFALTTLNNLHQQWTSCQAFFQAFLLKHGENMVDCLGAEVDRIEKNLKKNHPEVWVKYLQWCLRWHNLHLNENLTSNHSHL